MKYEMKRMAAAMMAAMTLMGGAGITAACAETSTATEPETTGFVGLANPWVEMESLAMLNAAADVNLQLPPVMGVTDVVYRLACLEDYTLAEVDFKVNGVQYHLRASGSLEGDISGVYLDNGSTAFMGREEEGFAVVTTDTMKLARWIDINGQYVLTVEDNGAMDQETFEGIAAEMMIVTSPYQPVVLEEGEYYDTFSMRAFAEVTPLGNASYDIRVYWSDSADTMYLWTMTATIYEDGLLSYENCVKTKLVTDMNGEVSETEANMVPSGYFEIVDGGLCWTGAAEESCRECVFRLPED